MSILISKNPATGEEILTTESFDPRHVKDVVDRARKAQVWWAALSFGQRTSYIVKARDYMIANMDEIAWAISKNNGKPLVESLAEIMPMVQTITWAEKNARKILKPKTIRAGWALPTKLAYLNWKPVGVLGIIAPWNYPLSTPLAEVILGLAAGNTIVIKPSDVTGLVNQQIRKIVNAMNLPGDVFTMIEGRGDVGEALVKAHCDRVIVTGSVGTGKKVMAAAAETLTPITLELGGKDSMIILEDANIDVAASAAVTGTFYNAGQSCCSIERILVHESIAEKFLEAMSDKIKKIRIDETRGFDNDMGPVTYELQKKVYLNQSQDFAKKNRKTLFGFPDYDGKSNFMRPLVVEGADDIKLWNEETFGPVAAVKTFKSDDEAVALNNASPYGLTAMIMSKDTSRARRIAPKLRVGVVVINDAPFSNYVPTLPWGGVRDSGFGWVHGELGLKEMCQAQVVIYDIAGQQKQFWWLPHNKAKYEFFKNYVILFDGRGWRVKLRAFLGLVKNLLAMGPRL